METSFVLTAVIIILLVYLFNKYFIEANNYWRKRGIPTVSGALPIIGHLSSMLLSHKTMPCFCDTIYKANKGRSMIGYYQLRKPVLMLMDPELVKAVLISDFAKFHKNTIDADPKLDPLLAENPFLNTGEKWKKLRNRLSYALMSSKRLKIMFDSVAKVCEKFTMHLREKIDESKKGSYEVELKGLSNRFTGEVVARAGYGAEGDFFINGRGPYSFNENVEDIFKPTIWNVIGHTVVFFVPPLNKILRFSFISKKMDSFFRRIVREMIEHRRKNGIRQNDFLQVMLEKTEDENGQIDEAIITANATSFFIDGYETSAVTMGFFLHQLADHPDIQDKLRAEVKNVLEKHNGELTYESIGEMTYMDAALNESMRLYPAAGFIMKKCNETCKFVGKDGLECHVEPDTEIAIPIRSFHMDTEYWENPEIYNPERFINEDKSERPKTVFLPFGEGPRICVGMRFALMQMKAAVATVIKDFSLEVSSRTKRPLEFKRGAILTTIEGGLWVNIKSL